MISNPYSFSSQIGYEEVLYLVKQLSNSDKAKLVKEMYEEIPQKKTNVDALTHLNQMADRLKKRTKSVNVILEDGNNTVSEKKIKLNVSKLNIVSIEDAKKGNYQNKMDKSAVVGKWPGDESVEELLNMLTK